MSYYDDITDPETADFARGDCSREDLVNAIAELKNRLHDARASIHKAYKPEFIDINTLSRSKIEVAFYALLGDLSRAPDTFICKDGKYPVLVLVNGLQVSFQEVLTMMIEQHDQIVETEAVLMLQAKLGDRLVEAQEIVERAVRDMSRLFPNARRNDY